MMSQQNPAYDVRARATFDGHGLESALRQGSFDKPASHLTGMMKASDQPGHVSFSNAGCSSWVDFPSGMIAEAQLIGQQTCKDHSHPIFKIAFKEPDNPEARVFLRLLEAHTNVAPPIPPVAMGHSPASELRRPQCTSWCVGSTLVCACPVYIPGLGMGYVIYTCGTCINDPVFTAFA